MPDLPPLPPWLQEQVDWVNQPPPPQARDTHALYFNLEQAFGPYPSPPQNLVYTGFMFFRPGDPRAHGTQRKPGLNGSGFLVPSAGLCHLILKPATGFARDDLPPYWVRVALAFGLEQDETTRVFAGLELFKGIHSPEVEVGNNEFSDVVVAPFGLPQIYMDWPYGWRLTLTKTTVLI